MENFQDCKRAPAGWSCTREFGHGGPCAAIQDLPEAERGMPPRDPTESGMVTLTDEQILSTLRSNLPGLNFSDAILIDTGRKLLDRAMHKGHFGVTAATAKQADSGS